MPVVIQNTLDNKNKISAGSPPIKNLIFKFSDTKENKCVYILRLLSSFSSRDQNFS